MLVKPSFTQKLLISILLLVIIAPLQFGFLEHVPVSLQSIVIIWISFAYGCLPAVLAVVFYLVLAAAGVPVLSGYNGGWEHFTGQTGGFLFGFPIVAFLIGKYRSKVPMLFLPLFTAFIAGHLLMLFFGYFGLAAHGLSFLDIMEEYYHLVPGTLLKSVIGAGLVRIEFLVRSFSK